MVNISLHRPCPHDNTYKGGCPCSVRASAGRLGFGGLPGTAAAKFHPPCHGLSFVCPVSSSLGRFSSHAFFEDTGSTEQGEILWVPYESQDRHVRWRLRNESVLEAGPSHTGTCAAELFFLTHMRSCSSRAGGCSSCTAGAEGRL